MNSKDYLLILEDTKGILEESLLEEGIFGDLKGYLSSLKRIPKVESIIKREMGSFTMEIKGIDIEDPEYGRLYNSLLDRIGNSIDRTVQSPSVAKGIKSAFYKEMLQGMLKKAKLATPAELFKRVDLAPHIKSLMLSSTNA